MNLIAKVLRCSAFAILHCAALADSARDLIEQGNEHFAAGRYSAALEVYNQAVDLADPRQEAELLHNRAATHFKLGRIDDARELWVRAANKQDATFEARSRYNLGNCHYAQALKAIEALQSAAMQGGPHDLQPTLDLLERAAEHYVDGVRLDPSLANARANLELAQLLKKQLQEQSTTQPSSKPQQGQSTSQPSSQPRQPDGRGDSNDQQQSQQPQSQPSPTSGDSGAEQTTGQGADQQPTPQDAQPQDQPPIPIKMTRDQAERLLQRIRDMERARRRELARREAARHRPVKRDW